MKLKIFLFLGVSSLAHAATPFSAPRVNFLMQGWATSNEQNSEKDQPYRLRRAEIKLNGTIAEQGKYVLMVDPAKLITAPGAKPAPRSAILQDVFLGYGFASGFELLLGQFKTPTTAEGLDSSGKLLLPERSLVGRTFGDRRELGVQFGYKAEAWNLAAMLSGGESLSSNQQNEFDNLHLRAEARPIKDLSLGSFVTLGDFDYSRRGRWGLNAREGIGKAEFRAEYAQGRDGAVHSRGFTTEAGYRLTESFQSVARFETFNLGKAETIGMNFLIPAHHTQMQLAGTVMQNMAAPTGTPSYSKGANNKLLTFALQTTF